MTPLLKMDNPKPSYKRMIWKKLYEMQKEGKKGKPISLVSFAQNVGCSLAHTSTNFKMARLAGFLEFHENGDYCIKKIPKWDIYDPKITKISGEYRKSVKGTGKPTLSRARIKPVGIGFGSLPEKVDESNILSAIQELLLKIQKLTEERNKLILYIKKLRGE